MPFSPISIASGSPIVLLFTLRPPLISLRITPSQQVLRPEIDTPPFTRLSSKLVYAPNGEISVGLHDVSPPPPCTDMPPLIVVPCTTTLSAPVARRPPLMTSLLDGHWVPAPFPR